MGAPGRSSGKVHLLAGMPARGRRAPPQDQPERSCGHDRGWHAKEPGDQRLEVEPGRDAFIGLVPPRDIATLKRVGHGLRAKAKRRWKMAQWPIISTG